MIAKQSTKSNSTLSPTLEAPLSMPKKRKKKATQHEKTPKLLQKIVGAYDLCCRFEVAVILRRKNKQEGINRQNRERIVSDDEA